MLRLLLAGAAFACSYSAFAQIDPPEPAEPPTLYDLYPPDAPRSATPESDPVYADPIAREDGFGRTRISEVPGESIDPRTGALTLSVADLVIPGNGGLDIVVSRTRRSNFFVHPGADYLENRSFQDTMADWRLDVPFIQLRSTNAYRSQPRIQDPVVVVPQSPIFYSDNPATCSSPYPASPAQTSGFNPRSEERMRYFAGVQFSGLAGSQGTELLLRGSPTSNQSQSMRVRQIYSEYGTADYTIAQCGGTRFNYIRPGVQSSFSVRTPDGKIY